MFQPDNLSLARQRRGMKKTTFAKAIGVTLQTLSAYENGGVKPSNAKIDLFATTLGFPKSFFYDDKFNRIDGASFRAYTRMSAPQRDAALASGALCVRVADWMDDHFELPEPNLADLQTGLITPEGAAAHMRALWRLGNAPITNLLNVAEINGVRVFALPTACAEVDAFSFWHGGRPFACIGFHKTPERAVFDLAHEIGHLVLHRDHAAPRGREAEREADQFASALLMPEADILANAPRSPSLNDLIRAKTRWRVAAVALNYRLHYLGLTSDWHYRELCIELSRMGRALEPNSIPMPMSFVWTTILDELRKEGTTRADVATALNLHLPDLDDLLRGLVVSAVEGQGHTTPERPARLRLV